MAPANALFDNVSVIWRKDASIYELLKNIGNDYSMLFFGAPLTFSEILPFVHRSKDVIGLSEMAFQILQVLAEMEQGCKAGKRNELLRRVYSAKGYFEIGSKRFDVAWRDYK